MFSRSRRVRVFMSALFSILLGAVVLKALSFTPPSAGAFSLSQYYGLEPIESVIARENAHSHTRWNHIEITYNTPAAPAPDTQLPPNNPVCYDDTKYHFIICNGFIGEDGQIIATQKWKKQKSITHAKNQHKGGRMIRIHIIPDNSTSRPTQIQETRTKKLTETLARIFHIQTDFISWINN